MRKVKDLSGDDLSLLVARAAGYEIKSLGTGGAVVFLPGGGDLVGYIGCDFIPKFEPQENWAQGGPLFSAARIQAHAYYAFWHSNIAGGISGFDAETELIAKARMFVSLKFGQEVEEVATCL